MNLSLNKEASQTTLGAHDHDGTPDQLFPSCCVSLSLSPNYPQNIPQSLGHFRPSSIRLLLTHFCFIFLCIHFQFMFPWIYFSESCIFCFLLRPFLDMNWFLSCLPGICPQNTFNGLRSVSELLAVFSHKRPASCLTQLSEYACIVRIVLDLTVVFIKCKGRQSNINLR